MAFSLFGMLFRFPLISFLALWSLVDVAMAVEDWGLTLGVTGSAMEAAALLIAALLDGWPREAMLELWHENMLQIVSAASVMVVWNVAKVSAAAKELLVMLTFTGMVHAAVTDEAGAVTGAMIESWVTPAVAIVGAMSFEVLAPKLANSLRRLVAALGPPMLEAQLRDAPQPQQGGGGAGVADGGAGVAGLWAGLGGQQAGEDEQPAFENLNHGVQPGPEIADLGVGPADVRVRAGQEEAARIAAGGPPNVNGPQPSGITITTTLNSQL